MMRNPPAFESKYLNVIALGGIPNKTQLGDIGIDGRIYPVSAAPAKKGKESGHLDFMYEWYLAGEFLAAFAAGKERVPKSAVDFLAQGRPGSRRVLSSFI